MSDQPADRDRAAEERGEAEARLARALTGAPPLVRRYELAELFAAHRQSGSYAARRGVTTPARSGRYLCRCGATTVLELGESIVDAHSEHLADVTLKLITDHQEATRG